MWEKSLIETKPTNGKKKWMGWPASFCLHTCIIAAIVVASYWRSEALHPVSPPGPIFIKPYVVPVPSLGNGGRKYSNRLVPTPAVIRTTVLVPEEKHVPQAEPKFPNTYDNNSIIDDRT
jgi:hypothetical protein